MKSCRFTQLSFSFGALLGQNMTSMRLVTFETAATSTLKAFGRTTVGFDFRHLFSPLGKVKAILEKKPSKAKCMALKNFTYRNGKI
jgi:lipid-binding SYLF domain-containing protein